ncbi:Epoxide hydrolase A [Dyadobacter sp. CECT 9623]|uniref:Epoxide hydrolase A n=1 Tax=Dyadobacter linearis TaxID=2823330 RepID=A0ABM8UIU2_9BACT|nr:alpha/beta hydrolase [Dyadobacter sp. CECT 9623]CAG5067437.1 Epoxide hydrolase A [Dyadobacter sp. CECT 9623]
MQSSTAAKLGYEYHYVNGLMLHVGHLGPAGGEIIVFLHGFPEFSLSWMAQAEFFARKGYHVIVPDQRGYNLSKKPVLVKDYGLTYLAGDIAALITSLTSRPVTVTGHDWGGGVAWALAQFHPQLVKNLIVLNMPHLHVMRENLRKNPMQLLRSSYAFFFQLPFIPEEVCSAFNFKSLEMSMVKTARPGIFSRVYLLACKQAWRQPNALTAMINWYRAFFQSPVDHDVDITVPVLLLWGANDIFLSKKMAGQSIKRCPSGQLITIENASHWLHHEEPAAVNQYIFTFLNQEKIKS